MKTTYLTMLVLPLFFSIMLMTSTQLTNAEPVDVENEDVRVFLRGSEKDNTRSGRTYFFDHLHKPTQATEQFEVHADTNAISELKIYKSTLIIQGKLNYGGESITRVNLETHKVEDAMWTYSPVFSSDNRFVVYVGHYPRSVPKNTFTTDIVRIYDFAKTPLENRVNPARGLQPRYCGIPVFPEGNARKKDEEFFVYDPNAIRNSVSPHFLWLENTRKILFITRDRSTGEYANFLIMIDLHDGIMTPRILRKRVDSSLSEGFRDGITEPIVIKEITETEDTIVITTYENYGRQTRQGDRPGKKDDTYTIHIDRAFLK
ncbi:hypothetical protein JW979_08640 [bacterium]|nr:hypothetical protein [candidate division CSSED10-310 bacterium]